MCTLNLVCEVGSHGYQVKYVPGVRFLSNDDNWSKEMQQLALCVVCSLLLGRLLSNYISQLILSMYVVETYMSTWALEPAHFRVLCMQLIFDTARGSV